MNTSSKKIVIVVEKSEEGYVIYDDTQTFLDVVHIDDKELVVSIVSAIVKDRISGNKSSSLW